MAKWSRRIFLDGKMVHIFLLFQYATPRHADAHARAGAGHLELTAWPSAAPAASPIAAAAGSAARSAAHERLSAWHGAGAACPQWQRRLAFRQPFALTRR